MIRCVPKGGAMFSNPVVIVVLLLAAIVLVAFILRRSGGPNKPSSLNRWEVVKWVISRLNQISSSCRRKKSLWDKLWRTINIVVHIVEDGFSSPPRVARSRLVGTHFFIEGVYSAGIWFTTPLPTSNQMRAEWEWSTSDLTPFRPKNGLPVVQVEESSNPFDQFLLSRT